MARSVWLVLAAAVAGATATALYLGASSREASPIVTDESAVTTPFASSIARLEAAASTADSATLEALIDQAAAQRSSWRRDTEFEALLMQVVEDDPRAAIGRAESLGLDQELLGRLFQIWAAADPDAALGGLRSLPSVAARRAVALALLDVFGVEEAATERVAAVLPPAEANNFRIDAIGKMAEQDLRGALERALDLATGQAETAAQQRIAVVMARIDPRAALPLQDMIEIPVQRIRYRDRLVDEWATIDPEAVLDYLATSTDLTKVHSPNRPETGKGTSCVEF